MGNSSVVPAGLAPSTRAGLRAGLQVIRSLLAGEEVDFDDVRSRLRDQVAVPLHPAASGPRNPRLAGEVADGAILLSGVASEQRRWRTADPCLSPFLAAAGVRVRVPERPPRLRPDLLHAESWASAVRACESFVDDETAELFARRFCLYGTADELAARLTELTRSGVSAVLLQHGGSYDLPRQLVADFAGRVRPVLRR
ncbi:Uncharacterised protein [Amycolatopsis camponoti]|uniref:LLM class flavin-dependent oxidoreductase n=1 Tax=Amycolatopsis camponoti TaxID=2606593 RepID=A0A6I8LXE5_9PSEU|nr:LLM class flavin-dependent oxidoreductase [Amycolatopsis camponoti]VVJ21939.1 Uncharacterised protein [Amycolatopsis camponoti]